MKQGNAVLGYSSHFDIEGASGLVVRAYGTACRLLKVGDISSGKTLSISSIVEKDIISPDENVTVAEIDNDGGGGGESLVLLRYIRSQLTSIPLINFGMEREKTMEGLFAPVRDLENAKVFPTSSEVQLLSLKRFDKHVRVRLGGLVMARSVKFFGRLEAKLSDQETREVWWLELRDEVKNHAKTMCCNFVIGYSETCIIYGDVCVLSAVGTAANVKCLNYPFLSLTSQNLNSRRRASVEKFGSIDDQDEEGSFDGEYYLYDDDNDDYDDDDDDNVDYQNRKMNHRARRNSRHRKLSNGSLNSVERKFYHLISLVLHLPRMKLKIIIYCIAPIDIVLHIIDANTR